MVTAGWRWLWCCGGCDDDIDGGAMERVVTRWRGRDDDGGAVGGVVGSRVTASDSEDRVDRESGSIFGVGRKTRRKSFPAAGDGGRVVAAGGGGDFLEEGATSNTNIKQCLRKVADGQFTAAVKVLSSSGVASYCDDTIKALEAKHPYKPPPSMPSITFFEPPLVAEIDSVFSYIKSFPKEFVASAPLTPLFKPDSGIRPIVVGTIFQGCYESCKLLLHTWYLDDGTVIGDSKEVARVLYIIKVSGPGLGLELNIKKTKIFWPLCNGMKLREGLFSVDIRRSSSGVKLLGGAVSRGVDFISGLTMRRAANDVDLMGLLPQLHDPQNELLLLRSCMASRAQSWVLQDHILYDSGICGMDDDYVSALACLRDTIPSFDFSGFTNKDTVPSQAQQTLANVLFSEMVKDMEVHFDMTMRQKAVFECLRKHACVDLTGVSPLVGLSSRGFIAGQAALKAASGKVTKQEKTCIKNQHVFIPFTFDTFGFLAPEAVELLSRVQRVMHSKVMTPRSTDVVFKRIGFAIQKGLAAQLVARLPSTTIWEFRVGKSPEEEGPYVALVVEIRNERNGLKVGVKRAIGVSSPVCKGKGTIAFWAGPNLVV
ncbi:hypothetical protein Tco_0308797 [Tanacetum coccineum]